MASEPHTWSDRADRTVLGDSRLVYGLIGYSRRVREVLVYSSAYLAFIAAAKVLIVTYLLALPRNPAPVVVGLITFGVYANDRLVDLEADTVSRPRRTAFVRRYRGPLYVLAAIAYGIAVALSVFGGPVAFGLALLPGCAWILYAIDWVPGSDVSFQRLKELPVVSSVLVAAAWALTVVLFPLAFADAPLTPAAWVLLAYFGLGTFVNTEIANAGDVESDRESGVSTLPILFGVSRTRHVLYGVAVLSAAVPGYAAVSGYLTAGAAAVLAVGPACLLGVVSLLGRVERDGAVTIAAECTRLPVFVLLAVPLL